MTFPKTGDIKTKYISNLIKIWYIENYKKSTYYMLFLLQLFLLMLCSFNSEYILQNFMYLMFTIKIHNGYVKHFKIFSLENMF